MTLRPSRGSPLARRRVERWVPGLRTVRGYERAWLRRDVVAGVVLAAILIPQGMAYAAARRAAGGHGPLHDGRLPGRLRPLRALARARARARLLDLAADPRRDHAAAGGRRRRRPRSRWPGMLAVLVGLTEIGLGLGKLGFVADLLSKEVQVGYMNGLAITIIVGQLPKLFGFSTCADSFLAEVKAFFDGLDETNATTLAVGLAVLRPAARAAAHHAAGAGGARGGGGRDRRLGAARASPTTASTRSARSRRGFPRRACRGRARATSRPLLIAAIGITLVSLTDTIATATSFAARRGEEVEPDQEMIGIGAANIAAGFFQGFAVSTSGSRTAVAEQSGAKSQVTGLVGAALVVVLLLFLNSLLADLPAGGARGGRDRGGAVADGPGDPAPLPARCAGARSRSRWWRAPGVILLGVLQGIVVAVVLAILLFFRRNWWPHGAVLGRVGERGGLARRRRLPRRRAAARASSSTAGRRRCSSPTRATSAKRSAGSRASANRAWIVLQCEAITDVDVTRRRDARAARRRAQRGGHPPRLRRAARRACRS